MTLSALFDFTNLADCYLKDKSCTTMTCFEVGIGENRSTATASQFFYGTLCDSNVA